LLLVSANGGLTRQTRRHAIIVSTLGVRRFIVAVNKMDLVNWSEARFAELESELRAFLRDLNLDKVIFIPLSARQGDNLVCGSRQMWWYKGALRCWNILRSLKLDRNENGPASECRSNMSIGQTQRSVAIAG
jgi:sulfate adenylyltransferase subunit 1 (EFTu-like GTPase family)